MATGLGIASLGIQLFGSAKSAQQQQAAGETSQQIGEFNAQIAEQNAALARSQAAVEEARVRKSAEAFKGKQKAAFTASGVDPGTGSPLLVLADTAREAEIEALNVRRRGEIQATGFEQEAVGERFTGAQAVKAGSTGAKATILSGAGRSLATGFKLKQAGAF